MKNYNKILEAVNRGIQLALDDYEDIEPISSLSQQSDVIDSEDVIKQKIELNKQKIELSKIVVDLDLPSGTLWCKYNLGVDPNKLSKPEDWYGDYYALGETIPNKPNGYNWETYQFYKENLTKYNKEDHLTELQLIDDPAYQNMHLYNFKFRMPSKADFEELIEETNNEWMENFNNSGVNGYKFISKSNSSKYVFLPAAGFCGDLNLSDDGEGGYYWSSSLYTDITGGAWNLYFDNTGVDLSYERRYYGFSVRPVINL